MTNRYLRHNLIDWFDQEFLKTLDVLVIGAGAVGNEVVKNLSLLGVGKICIVDMDSIEIHNLTRSPLFNESDVGKLKAEVARDAAKKLDPNCAVSSICGEFWNKVSFKRLQQSSVVFCCVDNFDARIKINRLCSLLGVDLINAGIDSRFVAVEIYPFMRDENSPCYECGLPLSTYQRLAERFSCGYLKKVAFEEKKVPTTVITASYAGALASSLFLYSYREDAEDGARKVFLDTISSTTSKQTLALNPDCPCCGIKSEKRLVVQSTRQITSSLKFGESLDLNQTVNTSDPILVSWEIPDCEVCRLETSSMTFVKASDCDDSLTNCSACGLNRRLPVVKDQFTVKELISDYEGKMLPGKYVSFESDGIQVLVELID